MIQVYVQMGNSAQKCAVFRQWTEREHEICQRLSNRFKSEVRALRGFGRPAEIVGRFIPHRVECSEGC